MQPRSNHGNEIRVSLQFGERKWGIMDGAE